MKKLLIFVFILLSGCYTIVRHPDVNFVSSSGEVYSSHVSYKSNCAECHSRSDMIYFYSLVPTHSLSPWVYYNTPWWLWWSSGSLDTVQAGGVASPERLREFGSHRATSDNNSFTPPPPTRTPPKSEANSKDSVSSTVEKGDKSNLGERKNTTNIRSPDESSGDQAKGAKQDSNDNRRNIGSRRR